MLAHSEEARLMFSSEPQNVFWCVSKLLGALVFES